MFNLPYIKQYIFKYRSARGDHLQLHVQDMSGDGNKRKGSLHPKWLSQNVKKCYHHIQVFMEALSGSQVANSL